MIMLFILFESIISSIEIPTVVLTIEERSFARPYSSPQVSKLGQVEASNNGNHGKNIQGKQREMVSIVGEGNVKQPTINNNKST